MVKQQPSPKFFLRKNSGLALAIPVFLSFSLWSAPAIAQYKAAVHRQPFPGEIPIKEAGIYGRAGATYILTNDISGERSTLFLGKDVTLDLNGYKIIYASGNYEHIENGGFEDGLNKWDVSRAPGARIMNTKDTHVFIGDKLMSLQAGDEILSSYITLPVANRSYMAMCGITGRFYEDMGGDLSREMKISLFVEDESGKEIQCITTYKDSVRVSCPVLKKSPRLGGGFITAHLNGLPAGKYRVRVRADTDCLVDEIDIRPAMDVGIGIVEKTYAMSHYDHLYEADYNAFFDYTADASKGTPIKGLPEVKGKGSVVIRNGVIENGVTGVMSWGVQSTADGVKVILQNLAFKTSGINTIAVDVPQASITNCKFEVNTPFIINRHSSSFYAVDLRGREMPSEVSFSEFYGGQGCLVFLGRNSSVHNNFFRNNQAVTNHYSIMALGDGSQIYNNTIEPETGSGIEIFRQKNIDIFNNTISVHSSPPTCEYGNSSYSTTAVRIADYLAKPGAANGAYGNRVYNNKITITATDFPESKNYTPMAWAVYYSASAGDNDIFGNDITINKTPAATRVEAAAFYICGGSHGFGGKFYDNRIAANVPAVWLASFYGGAANSKIYRNTIIRSPGAPPGLKPIRIGYQDCADCVAKNIEFRSNETEGISFDIQANDQPHSWSVYWSLVVKIKDRKGRAAKNISVVIMDKNRKQVAGGNTDENGELRTELLASSVDGKEKIDTSPFVVTAGGIKKEFSLHGNTEIDMIVNRKSR